MGPITHAGYCAEHGKQVYLANLDGLHDHEGPWFQHWRARVAASVGATLDERPNEP